MRVIAALCSSCQDELVILGSNTQGSGKAIYLLHGFTQSRDCWGSIGEELGMSHTVTAFDMPGHGASGRCMAGLVEGAELLAVDREPGLWIGYSMGGRFALHLALAHPELVERLVLVGAHPGLDSSDERDARLAADTDRAATIIVDGVDSFLGDWLELPLFAGLAVADRDLEARAKNSVEGLASSLLFAGTGAQQNLWPRLHELEMPVQLVVGELDEKFRAVAEASAEAIGSNAEVTVISGAGHSAHREKPDAFLGAINGL